MDVNSLSHSKWNCKYHIVFAPKFRRKVAYGALRQDIANILDVYKRQEYTKGLLESIPRLDSTKHEKLIPIEGNPVDLLNPPEAVSYTHLAIACPVRQGSRSSGSCGRSC